jgi:hypothetical protein
LSSLLEMFINELPLDHNTGKKNRSEFMNWKHEIILNPSHKGQPKEDRSRDRLKVNITYRKGRCEASPYFVLSSNQMEISSILSSVHLSRTDILCISSSVYLKIEACQLGSLCLLLALPHVSTWRQRSLVLFSYI